MSREVATLAGGCFWCLEAIFSELNGIAQVTSGYSGGTVVNPSYHQVCSETTGHAEAVQITFDPTVTSFRELLEVFFSIHNPTTLNQQGADVGTQYRSAIFYHSDRQKVIAEQLIEELNADNIWNAPIVAEVTPFKSFFTAEDYHQNYYRRNGEQPYCLAVISPKVEKVRRIHHNKLKN